MKAERTADEQKASAQRSAAQGIDAAGMFREKQDAEQTAIDAENARYDEMAQYFGRNAEQMQSERERIAQEEADRIARNSDPNNLMIAGEQPAVQNDEEIVTNDVTDSVTDFVTDGKPKTGYAALFKKNSGQSQVPSAAAAVDSMRSKTPTLEEARMRVKADPNDMQAQAVIANAWLDQFRNADGTISFYTNASSYLAFQRNMAATREQGGGDAFATMVMNEGGIDDAMNLDTEIMSTGFLESTYIPTLEKEVAEWEAKYDFAD